MHGYGSPLTLVTLSWRGVTADAGIERRTEYRRGHGFGSIAKPGKLPLASMSCRCIEGFCRSEQTST
jgi:hypothetical protein